MGTWKWKHPNGKIYKVISDPKKGTIHVYDEDSNLVMVKKQLSKRAISLVEKKFLDIVAENTKRKYSDYYSMYA
jgi:hypothetical protein